MFQNNKEVFFKQVEKAVEEDRLVLVQQVSNPAILRSGIVDGETGDGRLKVKAYDKNGGEFVVGKDLINQGFAENNRGSWRFYKVPMNPTANFIFQVTTPRKEVSL